MSQNFTLEGPNAAREGPLEHEIQTYLASAEYFDAMGIPLLRGEDFSGRETPASPLVAIVDDDLARRFWPGQNPIGRRIRTGGLQTEGSPWRTIVGVVGHVRHQRLDKIGREQIYLPSLSGPLPTPAFCSSPSGPRVIRALSPPRWRRRSRASTRISRSST
jgi:putative ABC transport system permease protein